MGVQIFARVMVREHNQVDNHLLLQLPAETIELRVADLHQQHHGRHGAESWIRFERGGESYFEIELKG